MRVLCVDPGFRALGYVVYDARADRIVDHGVVTVSASEYKREKKRVGASKADAAFLERAAAALSVCAKKHQLTRMVLELPHGAGRSFRATATLSKAAGMVVGWATAKSIPLLYYSPERCKKCATGDVHADKDAVEVAVRKRWPSAIWSVMRDREREHVCDAAALAMAALAHGEI